MKFDNEQITGELRWVDKTELMQAIQGGKNMVLQNQWRCWNASSPSDIRLIWRDVPVVKITELGVDDGKKIDGYNAGSAGHGL